MGIAKHLMDDHLGWLEPEARAKADLRLEAFRKQVQAGRDEPASPRVKMAIMFACCRLGIQEPLELQQMSQGEAGQLFRELREKERLNRKTCSVKHGKGVK